MITGMLFLHVLIHLDKSMIENSGHIIGKKTTPFLLSKIAEKTKGKSLESNIQLVLNNASLAAQIARSFTEMS